MLIINQNAKEGTLDNGKEFKEFTSTIFIVAAIGNSIAQILLHNFLSLSQ